MKHVVVLALVFALALCAVGCKTVTGGNYVLRNGETVSGDLMVTGGDAVLEEGSRVTGSLIITGGSVRANGQVERDVSMTGGSINFGASAVVRGVVQRTGGSFRIAEGAKVRTNGSSGDGTVSRAAPLPTVLILLVVLVILAVAFLWAVRTGLLAAPAAPPPQAAAGPNAIRPARGTGLRGSGMWGIVLIGLGVLFLLEQLLNLDVWHYAWPFLILIAGLSCFAAMILRGRGATSLAIPGSVLTMLGLIFLYQNTFDQFQTWSYAWALIFPTAVGIGRHLEGRWSNRPDLAASGFQLARLGLILFVVLAAFFELFVNLSGFFGADLGRIAFPVLLIVVGLLLIFGRLFNWVPPHRTVQAHTGTAPSASTPSDQK